MKIVTIHSQKGGIGKSTIAFCLTVAAQLDGKSACLLDLDSQTSAVLQRDRRQAEEPAVIAATASRLDKLLDLTRQQGAEIAFIDTPPKNTTDALAAMQRSDMVLIPTTDKIKDLEAMKPSVDTALLAKVPAYIYFCRIKTRSAMLQKAIKTVSIYQAQVAPVISYERTIYSIADITGQTPQETEPHGKAAQEIRELYQWLKTVINI